MPVEETALLQIHQTCLRNWVSQAENRVLTLIERWIEQLSAALPYRKIPAIQTKVEGAARYSLINQQTLQPAPDTITWIQIQQGNVRWMGSEELILNSEAGVVPLSDRLWIEAEGDVQLFTQPTEAIRRTDSLLAGLSQFHTQILRSIDHLEQQETQVELKRLQAQERLNRQVTAEALGELASTLGTQAIDFFADDSPLLMAAGAIGRALGVTIRPPAQSEDFKRVKEPMEAIMRASR